MNKYEVYASTGYVNHLMNMYDVYANGTYWGSWLAISESEAIYKALDHVCGPHWEDREDTNGLYAINADKGLNQ